jgi:hypothetical protein
MKIFNIIGITIWSGFFIGKSFPAGVYTGDLPFVIFFLLLIPFLLGKWSKEL